MRQIAAAFEDNLAHEIDWNRISELKASFNDPLDYCIKMPVNVDGVAVHILGITHSSDHSVEQVSHAISSINPGLICLESCVDRTQARRAVQLPLVEKYDGDWHRITSLDESDGPSLTDLAKHGLLEGDIQVAQFLVACGSVSGCPELTALYEAKKRNLTVESIDILESIKIVQNASIDACGYTARRQGDLSEGVLRQVIDEEGILSEYLRLMYGEALNGINVKPSMLYRLVESRKRSAPFADLLLRELHRVFRPKQFWSRIFLRDVYMALRIRRAVMKHSGSVLVVVGGAHVEGIRQILASTIDLPSLGAVGLSALTENADELSHAWRDVLKLDLFSRAIPRQIDNAVSAALRISQIILIKRRVSIWVSDSEWQVVDLSELGNSVGIQEALLDGLVDPYTVTRMEYEAVATASLHG